MIVQLTGNLINKNANEIVLDVNGIDALLHVSDLSHGRVKKPSDLVSIGQKLKVKITKIDKTTNRVSASIKALTEDPYEKITEEFTELVYR